jgi:hypothetical protein
MVLIAFNLDTILMHVIASIRHYDYADEAKLSGEENLKRAIRYAWEDLNKLAKADGLDPYEFTGPIWAEIGEPNMDLPPKFMVTFIHKKESICFQYIYVGNRNFFFKISELSDCIPQQTESPYRFRGYLSPEEIVPLLAPIY